MRPGAFEFAGEWIERVKALPETGMGYTIANVKLRDGRLFHQVVIDSGVLSAIRGRPDIPFTEGDIAEITATHERWEWRAS
jgi:hypothetical protein